MAFSGFEYPGSCTRMLESPRLAMVGSETPHLSTRLRIALTAWSTALSLSCLTASSFIASSNEVGPVRRMYMSG